MKVRNYLGVIGFISLAFFFIQTLSLSEYKVVNEVSSSATLTLILQYFGKDDYYLKEKSLIAKSLNFTFKMLTYDEFQFKITDTSKNRFQILQGGIFPEDPYKNFSFPISASSISIEYVNNPFDFTIRRKSTNAILFSTLKKKIIYSDYYIEIGTQISSSNLYGLGQRLAQSFNVQDGKWTMFNRDRGQQLDTGTGIQTYGYYPFYLLREIKGQFHVNYYRTTSALDAIKQTIDQVNYVTYKSIGGIINFKFFLGDSNPQTVIQKFHRYNGPADIPPFWSFGYHQSRWGYSNVTQLQSVIYKFKQFDIPLDTLWSDLDYMINSEVFTIDETRFPLDRMKKILENYQWIPIIDPGIKNSGYPYTQGVKRGVFILDANTKAPFLGKMRVGRTVYPDFFHPNASEYWSDMLDLLYKKVPFSGLWLDSNEFTSFCTGRCEAPEQPAIFDYAVDLPYSPGADIVEGDMPSLNSTHYGGLIEADVHIYNGYIQCARTYDYLKSKGKKPFILTRSSTLGSNKYAIHWTGDNVAKWVFLRTSIVDNFNNQLWGAQMVGADICGFASNTSDELCARWYQLGSFYPFSRNHNERSSPDQEPYALGENTFKAASSNLKLRYALLKYFYSIFVSQKGYGTIWKPLFFLFPNDPYSYDQDYLQTQFFFGNDLLIAPILKAGTEQRTVYFPEGNWHSIFQGDIYHNGVIKIHNRADQQMPLFIRQGAVIFAQDSQIVSKTRQLDNVFILHCGMKQDKERSNKTHRLFISKGSIMSIKDFNDDNLVTSCIKNGCFYTMSMTLILSTENKLEMDVTYNGQFSLNQELLISSFFIYFEGIRNIHEQPEAIKIKGPGHYSFDIVRINSFRQE